MARRLVQAATLGGAASLGAAESGRIEPGVRADLAVFDVPAEGDPYEALVAHGAGRCVATVLGGVLVPRGSPSSRPVRPAAVLGGSR